jgi:hypothetical protein
MKKIIHSIMTILMILFLSGCGEIEYTASVVPSGLGTPDPNQPIPTMTPVPTLGPGQYFDENDIHRPQVDYIEKGNELFGYGPVLGTDDLYAIWITDETGTHYLIVHKDSELLRGDIDPITEKRVENGFDIMMDPWVEISNDIDNKLGDINEQQESRRSSHGTALGIAGAGGFICGILTGGACFAAAGLAALTAWGKGVHHNGLRQAEIARLEGLQKDLADEENRLMGIYERGKSHPEKTQQPIQPQEEGGEGNEGP